MSSEPVSSPGATSGGQAGGAPTVEQHRFLNTILNTVEALILVVDAEGRIVQFNRACEKRTGYAIDELRGQPFWSAVLDQSEAGEVRALFGRLQATGTSTYHEHHWVARNGRRFWTSWRHTPVFDADGSIEFVVCCGMDISELKKAEQAVTRSRDYYLSLLEDFPALIWRCDTAAECDYFNRTWLAFTGRTMEEERGNGWAQSVHEDDLADCLDTFRTAFGRRDAFEMEYRLRRHDGLYRWVVDHGRPMYDEGGAFTGYLGACWDVTDQHQARDLLVEQARELERSNAELEQFAYAASHDLQEPLRMVGSFTQLLAQRYRGQLDDQADEFIEYAVDGAVRMQEMINGLLAYSRVGSRAGPAGAVDTHECFEMACRNLRTAIDECGARVTAEGLPTVKADRSQIERLFQNLIGNALKFRGSATPEIRVWALQDGEEWVFSVEDNGIGIDPQYAERVFLIFQRLHTRAEYPGTGIGLAICRKIVERHGGRIWVEAGRSGGCVFRFTIQAQGGEQSGHTG